ATTPATPAATQPKPLRKPPPAAAPCPSWLLMACQAEGSTSTWCSSKRSRKRSFTASVAGAAVSSRASITCHVAGSTGASWPSKRSRSRWLRLSFMVMCIGRRRLFGQQLAQVGPRFHELRFGGVLRDAELLGDLLVGETLDGEEVEDRAVARGQRLDQLHQLIRGHGGEHLLIGLVQVLRLGQ